MSDKKEEKPIFPKEPLEAPKKFSFNVVCSECKQEQVITAEKSFNCQNCKIWNQYPPVEEEEEEKPKKKGKWLS